jgi:hypothetical protein
VAVPDEVARRGVCGAVRRGPDTHHVEPECCGGVCDGADGELGDLRDDELAGVDEAAVGCGEGDEEAEEGGSRGGGGGGEEGGAGRGAAAGE